TTEALVLELDAIRSLLDQGLSTEAKDRLALLISNARSNPSILALARCALSTALEQQGHYRDSLAAVSMYEAPESRGKLDDQTVRSACSDRSRIQLQRRPSESDRDAEVDVARLR